MPPLLDDPALLPHADGYLWVPEVLPVHVPEAVLDMTVREWLATRANNP
jgi:hypothetical protein